MMAESALGSSDILAAVVSALCSGPFPGKLHPFRSSSKTFGGKITPLPHYQAGPLAVRTPLDL